MVKCDRHSIQEQLEKMPDKHQLTVCCVRLSSRIFEKREANSPAYSSLFFSVKQWKNRMRLGSEHNREFSNWQIVPATSVRNLWSVGNNVVEECGFCWLLCAGNGSPVRSLIMLAVNREQSRENKSHIKGQKGNFPFRKKWGITLVCC